MRKALSDAGLLDTEPFLVKHLPAPDAEGHEWEVVDGNHRVTVLMEMGKGNMEWSCRVLKVCAPIVFHCGRARSGQN